jgi:type I restriction enzyme, R subunit
MQTVTRANRVSSHQIDNVTKHNGEIVDYYNVFRNMRQALKDYALGDDRPDVEDSNSPIQPKSNLFILLDEAIEQGLIFCRSHDIDLESLLATNDTFKYLEQFKQFADILLQKDEWWKTFSVYDNTISSLYEACKPEILSNRRPLVFVFQYLRGVINSIIERTNIDSIDLKISELLDRSVVAEDNAVSQPEYTAEYKILPTGKILDLSKIDYDKLKTEFKLAPYKNIQIADLRSFIENKLDRMLQQNTTRTDFAQRLQFIVDRYNAGGAATENYYEALVDFAQNLKQESERHIREGLTEDELELFDLLKQDKMTATETQKVKLAAQSLLARLLATQPKVLVQDWYKDDQSKLRVKSTVEEILDQNLPDIYDRTIFIAKRDRIFNLIYSRASAGQKWAV